MAELFKGFEAETVWSYFSQICNIPRPSKKEEKIREFLLKFGAEYGLETHEDAAGNILLKKKPSPGRENDRAVILQGHMDMVCEKNSDVQHDFDTDAIIPFVDGEWVKAKGTTLGADDGIGVATMLAILADKNIQHGPLECFFTVDEETGMTGAFALEKKFLGGKILINLDSEDEGELFIGCAGGMDTTAVLGYDKRPVPDRSKALVIRVSGLKGGHSGDDIHKALGNSNKILTRILWNAMKKFEIRLSRFEGGNLRNAIPREAYALITVPANQVDKFKVYLKHIGQTIKEELLSNEPSLEIQAEDVTLPEFVINKSVQAKLISSLYACPNGVIAWSKEIKGLVETSTNLASVKYTEDNRIKVATSQRSSVNSAKEDIAHMVESVFSLAGARVKHGKGYPGWTPNKNSEILSITIAAYRKLFNKEPKVKAIHAGLECGLFLEKYPDMDMISFGPTIKGVHSPDERLDIASVKRFWDLLTEVLRQVH